MPNPATATTRAPHFHWAAPADAPTPAERILIKALRTLTERDRAAIVQLAMSLARGEIADTAARLDHARVAGL